MTPPDTEDASDSTSSSSLSAGTPTDSRDFPSTGGVNQEIKQEYVHRRDAVRRSSTQRGTSLSLSPSFLRGRDSRARRRQDTCGTRDRSSSLDLPSRDENITTKKNTRRSSATNDASRNRRREPGTELDNYGPSREYHLNDERENIGGTSEPGDVHLYDTPKGRPDSAPQKIYPYAWSLRTPSKQAGGWVDPKIGNGPVSEPSRRCHESAPPRAASQVETGARVGGGTRVRARGASKTNPKNRQAKTRPSTSIGVGSSGRGEGKAGGGECNDEEMREEVPLSSQEFGLRRWKEYAVLRHGSNRRFSKSQHGREILFQTASTIRAQEVEDLTRELKETRALAEELNSALRAEQAEKTKLQSRVVVLEREMEGMDSARRKWQRGDTAHRGRGSNLERRLAGNTGNLRSFLFGPDAKAEAATKRSPTSVASPPAGGVKLTPSRSRSPVAPSYHHDTSCSTVSGALLSPTGSEEDVEGAGGDGDVVRRVRETAELEKSELRRRHDVEMGAKQRHIEKLKLEIKNVEAERDGLRKASETQAELLSVGVTELKACLDVMKADRQPASEPAEPSPESATATATSLAGPGCPPAPAEAVSGHGGTGQHKSGVGGSGGGGDGDLFVGPPPSRGSDSLVETMLATEKGLNIQVRTLQRLLLKAVAAAVPTVVMPPAVTAAVDSIRKGMGLPSLVWAREPNQEPRDFIPTAVFDTEEGSTDSHSRGIEVARADLTWAGDIGVVVSDAQASTGSSHYHNVVPRRRENPRCNPRSPLQTRSVQRRPSLEERTAEAVGFDAGTNQMEARADGFTDWAGIFDEQAFVYRSHQDMVGAEGRWDDDESFAGSEGSGCRFPRVMPTDEDSDQEVDTAVSLSFEQQSGVMGGTSRAGGSNSSSSSSSSSSSNNSNKILPRNRQQRDGRSYVPCQREGLWRAKTTPRTDGDIPLPSALYGSSSTTTECAFHHDDGLFAGLSLSTKPRYEASTRDWSTYREESLHRRYAEMTALLSGTTNAALRPSLLDENTGDKKREGAPWLRERTVEGIMGSTIWSIPPAAGGKKESTGAI